MTDWKDWVGKREVVEDMITAAPAVRLEATLDGRAEFKNGVQLPPLWHWLYFIEPAPASAIGPDGHPKRGGFLPPIDLPRRMWAGGRLEFLAPIRIGETLRRTSEIASIESKSGRTGTLVFMVVRHIIANKETMLVREEQDIVYREPQSGASPPPETPAAPRAATWRKTINADPVMLFRYSALTFNGHRIHYDYPYVTEVENYPGLVVHGPLTATLMINLLRREQPGRTIKQFSFRGLRPLFGGAPFEVVGDLASDGGAKLAALTPHGHEAMTAEARFA
jgi:3-methylfumaryl-CoA hydratase